MEEAGGSIPKHMNNLIELTKIVDKLDIIKLIYQRSRFFTE